MLAAWEFTNSTITGSHDWNSAFIVEIDAICESELRWLLEIVEAMVSGIANCSDSLGEIVGRSEGRCLFGAMFDTSVDSGVVGEIVGGEVVVGELAVGELVIGGLVVGEGGGTLGHRQE